MKIEKNLLEFDQVTLKDPYLEVSYETNFSKGTFGDVGELQWRKAVCGGTKIDVTGVANDVIQINLFLYNVSFNLFIKDLLNNQVYVATHCIIPSRTINHSHEKPFYAKYKVIIFTDDQIQTEDEYNMMKALM